MSKPRCTRLASPNMDTRSLLLVAEHIGRKARIALWRACATAAAIDRDIFGFQISARTCHFGPDPENQRRDTRRRRKRRINPRRIGITSLDDVRTGIRGVVSIPNFCHF